MLAWLSCNRSTPQPKWGLVSRQSISLAAKKEHAGRFCRASPERLFFGERWISRSDPPKTQTRFTTQTHTDTGAAGSIELCMQRTNKPACRAACRPNRWISRHRQIICVSESPHTMPSTNPPQPSKRKQQHKANQQPVVDQNVDFSLLLRFGCLFLIPLWHFPPPLSTESQIKGRKHQKGVLCFLRCMTTPLMPT